METKYDVIALGELLIDFNQAALNDNGNYLYDCLLYTSDAADDR